MRFVNQYYFSTGKSSPEPPNISYIPIASGTNKFCGFVYALNTDKIYGIPLGGPQILEFDPYTDEISYFGNFPGSDKWAGAVYHPDGKIYCCPFNHPSILEIDPINRTATTFANLGGSIGKFVGINLLPTGQLILTAHDIGQFCLVDVVNKTASLFGTSYAGSGKWHTGILAEDGLFYALPRNNANILQIDPISLAQNFVGSVSGSDRHCTGVLSFANKIIMPPRTKTSWTVFDPSNNSVLDEGNFSGTFKYGSNNLDGTGKAWAMPFNSNLLASFAPNNSIETFNVGSGNGKYYGASVCKNGNVYGVGRNRNNIIKISNLGGIDPGAFVLPSNLNDLPNSLWNKYHNNL